MCSLSVISYNTYAFCYRISGALYGRALGVAILDLYKYMTGYIVPVDKAWEWMDPGVMAILGAGSLLGGVTRLTLAITVIIVSRRTACNYTFNN